MGRLVEGPAGCGLFRSFISSVDRSGGSSSLR